MASDIHIKVRDNLRALSAEHLHRALVDTVRHSVREMRDFARGVAPKRKDLLVEHIQDEEASELADLVIARMGVTAVEEADARKSQGRYRRSQYPLFVEGGTRSPIFPARKPGLLWNVSEGIFGRSQVRGQEPQRFMFATYVQAREILRADPSISFALKEMAVEAEAMKAAIEA